MFSTNLFLLKKLLEQVKAGKIQLPDFQRGWIWDDARIRGLLASLSRGFPIGAVMTLSSGSDIKFKTRPIEGVSNGNTGDSPDFFLLDGQQRLTSLYQSLRHLGPVDTSDSKRQKVMRWYYVNMLSAMDPLTDREDAIISVPENRKVTEDFGRQTVLDLSTAELEYQQHMIPTENLMDPMRWMVGYLQYWQEADEPHPEGEALDFFTSFQEGVQKNFAEY